MSFIAKLISVLITRMEFSMGLTVRNHLLSSRHFVIILLMGGYITACETRNQETVTHDMETTDMADAHNTLTNEEKQQGWILLFDGESTEGWRGYNQGGFPSDKWVVEDGTLFLNSARSGTGGDILYDQKFHNFRLSIEWKISEGGNSGIFYLGKEIEGEPIWKSAPEMQLLDNESHPDAANGSDGNRKAGSLYDLLPAVPQNVKPAGEWNHAEIVVQKGNVVHFQNGEPIVEYQLGTPGWERMITESKFAGLPEFGQDRPGYIALQDHRDDVWFRNIKIQPLD